MGKGYSRNEYDNIARQDYYRFVVRPVTVILGIYVVSAILQTVMHITWEPFNYIFTGIGGIPYLISYYKKELGI